MVFQATSVLGGLFNSDRYLHLVMYTSDKVYFSPFNNFIFRRTSMQCCYHFLVMLWIYDRRWIPEIYRWPTQMKAYWAMRILHYDIVTLVAWEGKIGRSLRQCGPSHMWFIEGQARIPVQLTAADVLRSLLQHKTLWDVRYQVWAVTRIDKGAIELDGAVHDTLLSLLTST